MSEWFSVKVDLRQGCVMSPWLFNLFMDGLMKEFKANMFLTFFALAFDSSEV